MKPTKMDMVKELMLEFESMRYYVGRCIDGDDELNLHELWEWLDSIVGGVKE